MGARFDRLRCEVFQNLFLSPMNTGFVRPAVATVLTACGIETIHNDAVNGFTSLHVATVLTACGIETRKYGSLCNQKLRDCCNSTYRLRY